MSVLSIIQYKVTFVFGELNGLAEQSPEVSDISLSLHYTPRCYANGASLQEEVLSPVHFHRLMEPFE